MNKEGSLSWHSSAYYKAHYNSKTKKELKPLRCPYCGSEMSFSNEIIYGGSPRTDWYWFCPTCRLTLPNLENFEKKFLITVSKKWRETLKRRLKKIRNEYFETKKLYIAFGKNFTPEEKRERLIEKIEEHTPEEPLE